MVQSHLTSSVRPRRAPFWVLVVRNLTGSYSIVEKMVPDYKQLSLQYGTEGGAFKVIKQLMRMRGIRSAQRPGSQHEAVEVPLGPTLGPLFRACVRPPLCRVICACCAMAVWACQTSGHGRGMHCLYALGAFRRLFGDYRYKEQAAAGGAQSHKTLCGSTTTREVMAQFDFFGTESCTVFYDMRAGG